MYRSCGLIAKLQTAWTSEANGNNGRNGKNSHATAGACSDADLCDNLTVGDPIADRQWFCASIAPVGTRGFDTFSTPTVDCERNFSSSSEGERRRFFEDSAAGTRRTRKIASVVRLVV
jgi:hypothetical protein